MAKPKICVSSAYYDLKHIKNNLEEFVDGLGYEVVLPENESLPFQPDQVIGDVGYAEKHNCHMLVLIIGGRHSIPMSDIELLKGKKLDLAYKRYNSIAQSEFDCARNRDIPIFVFVEKNVLAEYQTFKDNRDNASIKYAHVDSVYVYRLLEGILAQRRNTPVTPFEKFDDLSSCLRAQWAGLFADFLSRKSSETSLKDISAQLAELNGVSSVLKEYTESIMKKIQPDNFQTIINEQSDILKESKVKRFMAEPLIDYLMKGLDNKFDPNALYAAFEASDSLEDFLKRAQLSKDQIEIFLAVNGKFAKMDYKYLALNYIKNADAAAEE